MIPCQRDMFDIPENIAYLNCAYTSPLLKAAQQAGRAAVQAKANPWTIKSDDFFSSAETARGLFARLLSEQQAAGQNQTARHTAGQTRVEHLAARHKRSDPSCNPLGPRKSRHVHAGSNDNNRQAGWGSRVEL